MNISTVLYIVCNTGLHFSVKVFTEVRKNNWTTQVLQSAVEVIYHVSFVCSDMLEVLYPLGVTYKYLHRWENPECQLLTSKILHVGLE